MKASAQASTSRALSGMAASLHEVTDLDEVLEILTHGAVEHLDGIDFASITVLDPEGRPGTIADTHLVAFDADRLQYEFGEGPCIDSALSELVLSSDCIATDPRWPRYGPPAAALGIGSQVSIYLGTSSERRRSLNLYAQRSDGPRLQPESLNLFIAHAAYATGATLAESQMSEALRSRKAIGQALGIVMARYWLDEDRAFQYLVRQSQNRNVKLRDVCAEVVAEHDDRVRRQASERESS